MVEKEKAPIFEFTVTPNPAKSLELVSTILSLSSSVRAFTAKWKLIRTRLEDLNGVLAAVESERELIRSGDERSGVVEAVAAAEEALEECRELARMCVDLSYSGKLLMQSDLDVVLGKLDGHVEILSRVLSCEGLMSRGVIVVVRPGLGASRDDVRFYVRDLLRRMKIGDVMMKRQALVLLNEAMVVDERYVKVVVENEDVVNVLVNTLDSSEALVQEECAKVLYLIARFEKFRSVLIGSGAVGPLIRFLENGSELGKEMGVRCLMKLTSDFDNGWLVSAQGGVTALLKICSNGDPAGELVGFACVVLTNLAEVEEIKRFMVDEGAISVMIELVMCENEPAQFGSINMLRALAYKDEPVRRMIIKEGGMLALARVLDIQSPFSQKSRELALRAIDNLCFSSIVTLNSVISNGFLDQLLHILQHRDVAIQEMALKSVYRLCGVSEEARKAMGDAGFVPELIRFLRAKSCEVRNMASESLQRIVSNHKNLKHVSQDDHSISLLLQQLDPSAGNLPKRKFVLSTLLAISQSSIGRKKITRSHYMKNIRKLAETDGAVGKKLRKKLSSSNRFRNMISAVLHP